jgi:3-methyladenine DNA glycosylase/8-oxoguanine DNA glycosylase
VTTVAAPATPALLARDHVATRIRLDRVLRPDYARRGAVVCTDGTWFHRAEPGSAGPLLMSAAADPQGVQLKVWGPAQTPSDEREQMLEAAAAWVGLRDDLSAAREVLTATPQMARLLDELGEVRLSVTPRIAEALGRSIVEQLVQGKEARRSIAQIVACAGVQASPLVWHWPTATALGSTPVWSLRRCGVSGRMATALHASAVEASRLERARADWGVLERRLRALPGVGPWTSAETRLRIGDPDAVSVGDYHLPTTVGYALSGPDGDGPDGTWTDAGMLALLAPYVGQRGRVIRLLEMAAVRGLVARRERRGPRAALSAHRYW